MDMSKRIVSGLGIGSFVYLLVLLFSDEKLISASSILLTFFISICAGISSLIFEIETYSFLTCLAIHYLIINVVVVIGSYYLISISNYSDLLGSIFIIYLISYVVTYLKTRITSKEVAKLVKTIQKENKVDNE